MGERKKERKKVRIWGSWPTNYDKSIMLRLLVCTWLWWWWWWWWWWLWLSQSCPTIYSLSLMVCTWFNQPFAEKTFSPTTISIWWKKLPTYLKEKPRVQDDNVRSHVSIYLMEADLLIKEKPKFKETNVRSTWHWGRKVWVTWDWWDGGQEFLWSDNDKHSTTRCSKASKQGRRDIITMYIVCVCVCVSRYCQPLLSTN
jgi:hypothetical protein